MRSTGSDEAPDIRYDFNLLVVGLHLRWHGVYQRPQHLLSRLARHVPILVVEEPKVDGSDLHEWIEVAEGVTVLRPHYRLPPSDAIDERTLSLVLERARFARPLLWLYTPMMSSLAAALPGAPLVFDAMDDLAQFAQADPRLTEREAAVMSRADIVFCGGPSLYRSRKTRAPRVRLYSSGVDVDFFERARRCAPHALLAGMPQPVFGYIGVIDERIDLQLVAAIADARPDATLAMIGPTAKISPASLPQRANIVYLGQQAYTDLPALLAGIDVALMPFALNESTRSISPTKTLEYLAAGKPVVSTAIADVAAEYSDLVTIARNHADFIAGLESAPGFTRSRQPLADERTRASTWNAISAAMLRDLESIGIVPHAGGQSGAADDQLLCPCTPSARTIAAWPQYAPGQPAT